MRIALGIEYVGTAFCGWQTQHHARTVQNCLETALSKVADHPISTFCAGRTDTGVHALGQVIHFETAVDRNLKAWTLGTNYYLPKDISVLWVKIVDEQFHARFSALQRHYNYLIINRPTRPAVLRELATWEYRPLAVAQMQMGAHYLIGTHDFTSYRSTACQAPNPVRTLTKISVSRRGENLIISVSANAFLHHMVRNIAGVLMAIGRGEHSPEWALEVLKARDRTVGGMTAPAAGLYLMGVDYPNFSSLSDPPPW